MQHAGWMQPSMLLAFTGTACCLGCIRCIRCIRCIHSPDAVPEQQKCNMLLFCCSGTAVPEQQSKKKQKDKGLFHLEV